jgi:hypothetical protein
MNYYLHIERKNGGFTTVHFTKLQLSNICALIMILFWNLLFNQKLNRDILFLGYISVGLGQFNKRSLFIHKRTSIFAQYWLPRSHFQKFEAAGLYTISYFLSSKNWVMGVKSSTTQSHCHSSEASISNLARNYQRCATHGFWPAGPAGPRGTGGRVRSLYNYTGWWAGGYCLIKKTVRAGGVEDSKRHSSGGRGKIYTGRAGHRIFPSRHVGPWKNSKNFDALRIR